MRSAAASMSASVATGMPASTLASWRFGVTTVANGSIPLTSATGASGSSSVPPDLAILIGSCATSGHRCGYWPRVVNVRRLLLDALAGGNAQALAGSAITNLSGSGQHLSPSGFPAGVPRTATYNVRVGSPATTSAIPPYTGPI